MPSRHGTCSIKQVADTELEVVSGSNEFCWTLQWFPAGCTATGRRRQSPERWIHVRRFWPSLGRDRSTGSSPTAKSTGRAQSRLFWPLRAPTDRGLRIGVSADIGSPVLASAAQDTSGPVSYTISFRILENVK